MYENSYICKSFLTMGFHALCHEKDAARRGLPGGSPVKHGDSTNVARFIIQIKCEPATCILYRGKG